MKTLKTNNAGRMPLWQEDLNWIQASYQEAIGAIVGELGLGKDYFIIKGCSPYHPSGNTKYIAMNPGWFWYGGRILPVRGLSQVDVSSYTNPMVRLSLVTYYDTDGARNFIKPDMTTQTVTDVWQDDYLSPSIVECSGGVSFNSGVRLGVGAWTLSDIIANNKKDNESEWISGRSGDLYYKQIGNMVVLRGIATNVTGGTNPVDEGFPEPMGGLAMLHTDANTDDFLIYITGRGELVCCSKTGGQGEPLLTGMMYMAATPYQLADQNTINDNPIS